MGEELAATVGCHDVTQRLAGLRVGDVDVRVQHLVLRRAAAAHCEGRTTRGQGGFHRGAWRGLLQKTISKMSLHRGSEEEEEGRKHAGSR